jgi:hypothetical protein
VLALKLFLVPTFIALIAVSGKLWGASAAGLLSGLPVIAGSILWIIYLENGLAFAQKTAVATVSGIIPLSSFCFVYAWLCSRLSWKSTLFIASVIYFAIAISIGKINLEINESAGLAIAVVLMQMYFSPNLSSKLLKAPASNTEIVCRMLFALLLVITITHYANILGETYSGIFAAFPIAGSTIAIFSHRNYSTNHAIQSLKSMKQGLLSMLVFFYIVSVYSSTLGFVLSILLATLAGLFLQVFLIYINNWLRATH